MSRKRLEFEREDERCRDPFRDERHEKVTVKFNICDGSFPFRVVVFLRLPWVSH